MQLDQQSKTPAAHCEDCCASTPGNRSTSFVATAVELGGYLALIIIGSRLLRLGGLSTDFLGEGHIGFGVIFLVGLVAALSSCLALVGGLLLSVAATWRESHERDTHWHRLQPLLMFNIGRLAGYFLLGGLIGWIGTAIGISTRLTAVLTVIIASVMVVLGLHILRLLPRAFCHLPLPRPLANRLRSLGETGNPAVAALLGALTFFVPCGFTQSMQLLALGSGSFMSGGLIMLTFALGTLPALLGISVLSSFVEGRFARWFLRFSGVLVLVLGLLGIRSGLALSGLPIPTIPSLFERSRSASADPNVTIDEKGRQILSLTVRDSGFVPSTFTIDPKLETWVYAYAPEGVSGCATFLLAPSYNLRTQIRQGENWLGPIASPRGDFVLTCSMGMLRSDVHVRS